jgi:hypothetical protein
MHAERSESFGSRVRQYRCSGFFWIKSPGPSRSALSIPATGLVVAIEPAPGSLECFRRSLSCERYRLSQERPPIQDRTAFRDVQRGEQILWKAEVGSSTATKRHSWRGPGSSRHRSCRCPRGWGADNAIHPWPAGVKTVDHHLKIWISRG